MARPNHPQFEDDEEEPGFFTRFRVPLIVAGVLLLATAGWLVFGNSKPAKKKSETRIVAIAPPPPPTPPPPTPPPTPPPEEPPPEEKPPEFQEETQPEEQPPEPEPAEAPLGTNVEGDGDDGFGLAKGGGSGFGSGLGKGTGNRSKYGFYAGQVQRSVVEALRAHKSTRSATLALQVRIWVDNTGRVTRASLAGSSGSAATDAVLRDQILTGLQLAQPPPEGMPMPIVMRITAKRPN